MNTEDIFKNNKCQFEDEQLPDGFAERFEKRLNVKCRRRKIVRMAVYVSSIAASIAILVGLTFSFDNEIDVNIIVNQDIAKVNISVDTTDIATENIQCNDNIGTGYVAIIDKQETPDSMVEIEDTEAVYQYNPEVEEVINFYQGRLDKIVFEIEHEGCFEIEDKAIDSLKFNPILPQEIAFMPIEEQLAVVVNVYTSKIRVAEQLSVLCENRDN